MDGVFPDWLRTGVLTAGFQTVVGYPLETIKTRLQASSVVCGRGLYRGCASPFMVQLCVHPVFFGVYSGLREADLPPYAAGAGAGVLSGVMVNPVEIRKTRLQTGDGRMPTHPGWWRIGMAATCARDAVGSAVYWHVFEGMEGSPVWRGGCAGVMSWIVSYPIDVFKTRQQASSSSRIISVEKIMLGFLVTIIRAFIVNAGILTIYSVQTSRPVDPR